MHAAQHLDLTLALAAPADLDGLSHEALVLSATLHEGSLDIDERALEDDQHHELR